MSMEFSGRESDKPITDQEGVMFAAQPVWERSRKRKGFGARKAAAPVSTVVAPEPRSFAAERDYDEPMALDTPVERPIASTSVDRAYARSEYATMSPAPATDVETDGGLVAPIGISRSTRSTRARSAGGVAPAAIAAGVVALGAIGATGWYMSRTDTSGVPELTAGSTTSQVAAAPLAPVDPPAQMAANDVAPPPPAATPRAAEPARTSAPARSTARARPAQASSAATSGVNASTTATLPEGPQPYSSVSPSEAPAPVTPPLVTLPPPASAAPAAVPSTPPTATPEPAPAPEATPQTATPPQ